MQSNIVVIGSCNTDMVIKSHKLPAPGETILGGTFFMNPGGKGANQAVAAARLGGKVTFIGKVGADIFGKQALQIFENEGINAENISTDYDNPSGVALITVDKHAENCIVVAPGANSALSKEDILNALPAIKKADILLLQLEIPLEVVDFVAQIARENNKKMILNPAPAAPLKSDLIQSLYLITPNKTEVELLSGIYISDTDSMHRAALILKEKGASNVIITLGKDGAYLLNDNFSELIPGIQVEALDTTAAGDVFNGALTLAISEGMDLKDAIIFAHKASALSVTRMGAQSSIPYRKEIV